MKLPRKRSTYRDDPNMPVYRNYRMYDGKVVEYVDPEYETRYRSRLLSISLAPDWHNDPTYNMKRKP